MSKKSKPTSGRPTKLTPKTVSLLETHLQFGHTVVESCYVAKISRQSFYKYYREDPQFADKMRQARFQLIRLAKQTVYAAVANGDTKAAMWVIEKFAPDSLNMPLEDEIPSEVGYFMDDTSPVTLDELIKYKQEREEYQRRHRVNVNEP